MGTAKRYIKQLLPSSIVQARLHKNVFLKFAERNGFVYFGSVHQHDNAHRLIRGLTLSPTHKDSHYCLGSSDGYDIAMIERKDTIRTPGGLPQHYAWLILAIDLQSSHDFPHLFVGNTTHSENFYRHIFTKFPYLTKLALGESHVYPESFSKRRVVYASLRDALTVGQLVTPDVATRMQETFGSITFEVHEHVLYMYAEHQRPSGLLLSRMLHQGLWLAKTLDASLH